MVSHHASSCKPMQACKLMWPMWTHAPPCGHMGLGSGLAKTRADHFTQPLYDDRGGHPWQNLLTSHSAVKEHLLATNSLCLVPLVLLVRAFLYHARIV